MRLWKDVSQQDKPPEKRPWRRLRLSVPQIKQSEVHSWFDLFTFAVDEWDEPDADNLAETLTTYIVDVRECAGYVLLFHRIIEAYSALRLTKRSDRLIALSGVCELVQDIRGKHAAGLWEHSLCFDLMWRVERLDIDMVGNNDSAPYHGPSWSWVSVNRAVFYWTDIVNFFDAAPLLRFAGEDRDKRGFAWLTKTTCFARSITNDCVRIKLAGNNPFGDVKSAVLTGKASMAPAHLVYVRDSFGLVPSQYKVSLIIGSDEVIDVAFHADYILSNNGPKTLMEGSKLALLLVHPQVALVLTEVQLSKRRPRIPQYRRVGIARFSEDTIRYYKIEWMRFSTVEPFSLI